MPQNDSVGEQECGDGSSATFEVGRFQTVGCATAQSMLDQLLDDVAGGCGRVKITGSDANTTCVLISQSELASLEKAIEILSGTSGAESMREQIAKLVASAGVIPNPAFRSPAFSNRDQNA